MSSADHSPSLLARRLFYWPLSLLFLYSGTVKSLQFSRFAQSVGDFGLVWDGLVKPVALFVCVTEICLAYFLWHQRAVGALVTALLLAGFIGVLAYGIAMGLDIECGCFGPRHRLSLQSQLSVDVGLFIWCWLAYRVGRKIKEKEPSK